MLVITFVLVAAAAFADIFDRPAKVNLVVDNAEAFSRRHAEALRTKLDSFERATTVQIQIYTTKDLYGYDIVDFAQRLGEGWGVGKEGANNGIVIVYMPKTLTENGEVTIQTGYGIEPLIPDATCKRIIEKEMIPQFRNGAIYEGIDRAVDICIALTKGEFKNEKPNREHTAADLAAVLIFLVFIAVVVLLAIKFGKHPSPFFDDQSRYGAGWTATGSGWKGSGGFSSGGSSFGGFGGGHFGGGGASGRW